MAEMKGLIKSVGSIHAGSLRARNKVAEFAGDLVARMPQNCVSSPELSSWSARGSLLLCMSSS